MKNLIFILSLLLSSSILGNPQATLNHQFESGMLKNANFYPPDTITLDNIVGSSINNYNFHIKQANIWHYDRNKLVMVKTIVFGISAGLGYRAISKFSQSEDILYNQLFIGFCSAVLGGTMLGGIVQQKHHVFYYTEEHHIEKAIEYYNTIAPIPINHIKGVQLR